MVFPKQGFLRFKNLGGHEGQSLRIGRFEVIDGTEVAPKDATLTALKRDRIAHRLIGNFGFTDVGRSFDGARYVMNRSKLNLTVFAGRPTRGVFQVDGWGELKVNLFYGALTGQVGGKTSAGEWRMQTGSWRTLRHRAGAFAAEGGWQPSGGYDYGSGDKNPSDTTHGTFFQVMPTPRVYARFPFFNMMNSRDAFGELLVRPSKKVTIRSEVHSLRLVNRNDLWYSGGGAFQPWTFGYTGRASNGQSGLATLYDASFDYSVNTHVAFGLYHGHAAGKLAVQSIYPAGPRANFGFVEMTFKF